MTDSLLSSQIIPEQWQQWQAHCQQLGVSIPQGLVPRFEHFYTLLITANQSVNLTRITEPQDFLNRNLLDSLSISPLIPSGATVADVGSGAGFPALPLAILRSDIKVVAIESIGKKCTFIQQAAQTMGLTNVTVLNARSEDLAKQADYRNQLDVVIARAVAALPTLLELCTPLVRVGGTFIAMKGSQAPAELDAATLACKALKLRFVEMHAMDETILPGAHLLRFEKLAVTPKEYPRGAGLARKKPL